MQFINKTFEQLSLLQLFSIYKLRGAVFVVEQQCPYQDPDSHDLEAVHVLMMEGSILVGYARLLPPGLSFMEAAIGRVVVDKNFRRGGNGQQLMEHCISSSLQLFTCREIVISAQLYLLNFYSRLGFIQEGLDYLEDNIPHVKMRYKQK